MHPITKIRAIIVVLSCGVLFTGVATAAITGKYDPWRDNRSNDVLVPQTKVVELFTRDKDDRNKNFKFSYSRPIEIWPEHWCVNFAADVHSDYVGNMPYTHCVDVPETAPQALRIYVRTYGVSLKYVHDNMGR